MTDALTFEEARRELERIVAQLESGRADLEEAVALWERGEDLYRYCVGKLDAAESKIEELGRRADAAKPEPVSGPADAETTADTLKPDAA